MASEGLDTESGCLKCQSRNIQSITVTAENESCGNPGRAVRYCCFNCNSVHDTVTVCQAQPSTALPSSTLSSTSNALCPCWHTCPDQHLR